MRAAGLCRGENGRRLAVDCPAVRFGGCQQGGICSPRGARVKGRRPATCLHPTHRRISAHSPPRFQRHRRKPRGVAQNPWITPVLGRQPGTIPDHVAENSPDTVPRPSRIRHRPGHPEPAQQGDQASRRRGRRLPGPLRPDPTRRHGADRAERRMDRDPPQPRPRTPVSGPPVPSVVVRMDSACFLAAVVGLFLVVMCSPQVVSPSGGDPHTGNAPSHTRHLPDRTVPGIRVQGYDRAPHTPTGGSPTSAHSKT